MISQTITLAVKIRNLIGEIRKLMMSNRGTHRINNIKNHTKKFLPRMMSQLSKSNQAGDSGRPFVKPVQKNSTRVQLGLYLV